MSRKPRAFKQADVARAVKGAVAAGVEVAGVQVDRDGKIVVIFGKPGKNGAGDRLINEWDEVLGGADQSSIRQ